MLIFNYYSLSHLYTLRVYHALASFLFDDAIIHYIESSVLTFDVSGKKQKVKCKIICQTASKPVIIILRFQSAVCSLLLIVLHFRVHIVDGSDRQKIQRKGIPSMLRTCLLCFLHNILNNIRTLYLIHPKTLLSCILQRSSDMIAFHTIYNQKPIMKSYSLFNC